MSLKEELKFLDTEGHNKDSYGAKTMRTTGDRIRNGIDDVVTSTGEKVIEAGIDASIWGAKKVLTTAPKMGFIDTMYLFMTAVFLMRVGIFGAEIAGFDGWVIFTFIYLAYCFRKQLSALIKILYKIIKPLIVELIKGLINFIKKYYPVARDKVLPIVIEQSIKTKDKTFTVRKNVYEIMKTKIQ